jgi:hypothetical protein
MIDFIKLFAGLILPTLLGYKILSFILKKNKFDFFTSLALSFGLGLGVLPYIMLLLGMFNVHYSFLTIGLGLVFVSLVLDCTRFLPKFSEINTEVYIEASRKKRKASSLERILMFFFCFFVLYYVLFIFFAALSMPVFTWDSIATSVYNAKVLFFEGNLHQGYKFFAHKSYPIGHPMVLTWLSFCLGRWDDQLIKIVFPFMFIAFVRVFYTFLKEIIDEKCAYLGVFLLFSSNFIILHATISYRDIFMMYYNCLTIFFIIFWQRKGVSSYLWLASLFSAIGIFMKLEGSLYFVVASFLLSYVCFIEKRKILNVGKFMLMPIFLGGWYAIYKRVSGCEATEYTDLNFLNLGEKVVVSAQAFFQVLFFTANWNIIWFLFIFLVLFYCKEVLSSRTIRTLTFSSILFLAALFLVSIFSNDGDKVLSLLTLSRLILHFFPMVVGVVVIILRYSVSIDKSNLLK